MAPISEKLDRFFDEKMKEYPTSRSFLVPMLLYSQDEVGFISDEVIAHLAKKTGLTELEVRNVISYYSMLRTRPAGKFNVQVCTNICCMLRGSDELFEHCKNKAAAVPFKAVGVCSWQIRNTAIPEQALTIQRHACTSRNAGTAAIDLDFPVEHTTPAITSPAPNNWGADTCCPSSRPIKAVNIGTRLMNTAADAAPIFCMPWFHHR
jgi:hypothetical protein